MDVSGAAGQSRSTNYAFDQRDPSVLRLAVGLGDAELERTVILALSQDGDVAVTRFLSADALIAAARNGQGDAALLSSELYRLDDLALEELGRLRIPVVLLTRADSAVQPSPHEWVVLPASSAPSKVCDAVRSLRRGPTTAPPLNRALSLPPHVGASSISGVEAPRESEGVPEGEALGTILAVWSGPGSPGRTTLAVNLGVSLAQDEPTVVVDADLVGPSISAYLDLDPTRNLCMVAHATARDAGKWERAVSDELQPLAPGRSACDALCGVPRAEQRGVVSAPLLDRVLRELARRYRYVVLDVGADIVGADAVVHRLALQRAQTMVLVSTADLVGLWRTTTALQTLGTYAPSAERALALAVNRYDARRHYSLQEVEWTLKLPVTAAVPDDRRSVERAQRQQDPLVLAGQSKAAHAVLDLARRLRQRGTETPSQPAVAVPQGRPVFQQARLLPARWWSARAHGEGGRAR